ncbi:methionine--tRNA ligase [Candidatus Nanohalococcus occultus]|uniref:methionine--tRNA ligase n=1 Tax=Candidatus Nanohalococcus occultus TaxID=2978047 RepID=UPI0039DFC528
MTEQRRVTVTSALPYIHGVPHLGNIVGSMLPADIFHRYLDIRGVDNILVGGSDVHGTPLELEAMERDMEVEDLKDENHRKVKEVLNKFEIDFSIYSNTHSEFNERQTHDMFEKLYLNGYIKEDTQRLPYSAEDDRFLPDRYIEGECPECGGLARGDQCDDCGTLLDPEEIVNPHSTISGSEDIEFKETKHLFLDLPQFKEKLLEWLEEADESPVPDSSLKEVKNAIENTERRAITRDIDWGFDIPVERVNEKIEETGRDVPKLESDVYSDKVLYVWFDAPIGYIGFTRELFDDSEEWKDYWMNGEAETYYSIGKDNTIFHTVIWPSMLMGSSTEEETYNLPSYEFIQQFLMAEDTQFSKSRGKGLSTEDALEMQPADYWRFYLARNLPQEHDAKFSFDDFEAEINNVLNDTVGNFVNRTLALTEKWFDNEVPVGELEYEDRQAVAEAERVTEEYVEAFEDHDIRTAVEKAVELARVGDRYLSKEEPWNNEDRREPVLQVAVQIVRGLGVLMYPFTPEASENIAEMLDVDIHTEEGYDELQDPLLGGVGAGEKLGERKQLFEKIEVQPPEEENDSMFNEETVSFEDFGEMDLRVGEVKEVEEHPNADKLYKVQIDVGEATLQTCAGLKNHYEADDLVGRRVVVLANLEPAELRGEKSECMMLAAEDEDGNVSMLTTDKEIEVGSKVR